MCVSVLYFQSSQQTECPSPSHCCGSISKCFEPERHKISGCCTGSLSTRKCKLLKWREQLTKSYKEQEARRSKQTYFILLWQRFYKSYYSGWSAASVRRLYYLGLLHKLVQHREDGYFTHHVFNSFSVSFTFVHSASLL